MKLKLNFFLVVFSLLAISCNQGKKNQEFKNYVLKITLDYERQPGYASNQYAVWIEDVNGVLIKTLFVTSFTADGGYKPRPACVPVWVQKANPDNLSNEAIDAFSGATPSSGLQTYVWDFTDADNNLITDGTYYFFVEGTLYGDSEVIYKAPVTIGRKDVSTITAIPAYTSEDDKNKHMIKSVTAEYIAVED
jgi:hypothetical protein